MPTQYQNGSGPQYTHFRMSQDQMRRKTGSNVAFEGPLPLCGNGSYWVASTDHIRSITCPKCLEILQSDPDYL